MSIYAVGIGPGNMEYMAPYALEVLQACDVIIGYTTYLALLPCEILQNKEVIESGMRNEVSRCETAFAYALGGKDVAVVSGGDAGVYGMASLIYEMGEKHPDVSIEVIPGITAATSAASILGAPLSNDFAVISLSDLLTPWEIIEKNLFAAAQGNFVICIYNPQSRKRIETFKRACKIILEHRPPQTCCGYVRNALRRGPNSSEICSSGICSLDELSQTDVDMLTTVIIGNSMTRIINGKLVTSRGYKLEDGGQV